MLLPDVRRVAHKEALHTLETDRHDVDQFSSIRLTIHKLCDILSSEAVTLRSKPTVYFDSSLSFKPFVHTTAATATFHIRSLVAIRGESWWSSY